MPPPIPNDAIAELDSDVFIIEVDADQEVERGLTAGSPSAPVTPA